MNIKLNAIDVDSFVNNHVCDYTVANYIKPEYYERYDVKRGLRNTDGTGVMAGVTLIGNVYGYNIEDAEKIPQEGRLVYRGINIEHLIDGFVTENRFGFEEVVYLILFGSLPDCQNLDEFENIIKKLRYLPNGFTEDMILKAPSHDIMNKLARSVLALYSYDPNPDDTSVSNMFRQSLELVARLPSIASQAYAVKRRYYEDKSLVLHRPNDDMSIAENFLHSIRTDSKFTAEEAHLLDLCLVLHAEHGGGNNSAFSCRVISSTGTDTYSAIASAIGSLKGPRHGGANGKVMDMFSCIERDVSDWTDDDEVSAYLCKIINKEAGDRTGLIYGMGHAIYTLSDPRAKLLKRFARSIAEEKGMSKELDLFETVERLAPQLLKNERGIDKPICANVDMYSGLVYKMLDIPEDLFTPLFAVARIAGWCAHRMEEVSVGRIIRPAYKAVVKNRVYVPIDNR